MPVSLSRTFFLRMNKWTSGPCGHHLCGLSCVNPVPPAGMWDLPRFAGILSLPVSPLSVPSAFLTGLIVATLVWSHAYKSLFLHVNISFMPLPVWMLPHVMASILTLLPQKDPGGLEVSFFYEHTELFKSAGLLTLLCFTVISSTE